MLRKEIERFVHLSSHVFICTNYPGISSFISVHLRLIAAVAPAEAKSCCRPLALLGATLGRLLVPAAIAAPVLVRLLTVGLLRPLMLDVRRAVEVDGGRFLLGLAAEESRALLTATPFLRLVAGGSGRGRLIAEGL